MDNVQILEDIYEYCSKPEDDVLLRKLKRKVKSELKFLSSLDLSTEDAFQKVRCSNVSHIRGVYSTFVKYRDSCCSVFKSFSYHHNDVKYSVTVDLVLLSSLENLEKPGDICSWIKVISRNPISMQTIFKGNSSFGEKCISQHGYEYLECARDNPHNFISPNIIFVFTCGVTNDIKYHLEKCGITVITPMYNEVEKCVDNLELANPMKYVCVNVPPVNLDVTALICMCSELCHGQYDFDFNDSTLNRMGKEEANNPALPIIESFTAGKRLLICKSALDQFLDVVSKVAGPKEQDRANSLLPRLRIVSDNPSETFLRLRRTSRIRDWNCAIFGTGASLSAVTLSANTGFIRAANNQGIKLAVYVHPPRAFTEQKQPLLA